MFRGFEKKLFLFFLFNFLFISPLFSANEKANLLIVLDGSGSMQKEINAVSKIDIVKKTLKSEISKFPKGSDLGLIAYGFQDKSSCEDVKDLLPLTPINPNDFSSSLEKVTPKGKTPLYLSLKKAVNELMMTKGESTLLVIADGQDTCGGNPCDLIKDIRNARIKTVVDVIGFGVAPSEREQLKCIAQAGAGNYFHVTNEEEFQKSIQEIFSRMLDSKSKRKRDLSGGQVTTSKNLFLAHEDIKVLYSGLPGNSRDWVTVVKAGKANNEIGPWTYSSGKGKGEFVAKNLPPGDYEARLYLNWPDGGYNVQSRHRFTIHPTRGRVSFKTNKKTYSPNEEIVVEFSKLPGNSRDWITIVETTAPQSRQGELHYTQGKVQGKVSFKPLNPGEYEARLYYDWPKGGYDVKSKYVFKVIEEPS